MINETSRSGKARPKIFGQSIKNASITPAPLFGPKAVRPATAHAYLPPAEHVAALSKRKAEIHSVSEGRASESTSLKLLPSASNTNTSSEAPSVVNSKRLDEFGKKIMAELYKSINLVDFARKKTTEMNEEIRHAISVIQELRQYSLTPAELEHIAESTCNEMLGFGPLESLLARDDIADIMVNGPDTVFIEVNGKIQKSDVRFRDAAQLNNICRRIAEQVGRRIDESSPMCDARLPDGSRVNIVFPPLVLDGAALTIRKFKKDALTLEKLLKFGAINEQGARLLQILATCRVNVLISGGTGSGKTTMLNSLTAFIRPDERIITCEDAAELQLQQPHVVRMETRPPNLENVGMVTMRDLVRNCLRMRPERIIVGEVRGPEAFDLLQAMNTGHDGSMGTLHANTPREAVSRLENMVAMANLNIPPIAIRHQIASSLNVIIQTQRLHDGSRRVTHISEIVGMEGDVIMMQDLFVYEITGEDANGRIIGRHRSTNLQPRFYNKAKAYGLEVELLEAMGLS